MNSSLAVKLTVVCLLMSLLTFLLMGLDKTRAKARAWRIPEKVLFLFAALFGAPGGVLGMMTFRHKTRHSHFAIGFPLLAVVQIALLAFLYLRG